jgi:hypothetical protein
MHGQHSLQSLKRLFCRYNRLFLGNQLPPCTIHLGPVMGGLLDPAGGEAVGLCNRAGREITIDV